MATASLPVKRDTGKSSIMRGRGLYTSFEPMPFSSGLLPQLGGYGGSNYRGGRSGYGGRGGRGGGRKYSPPPSKGTVETKPVVIKKDEVITFFGREHFLSNFYASPFTINGHQYPTVEHYYEACKVYALVGAEWARNLKAVPDPGAAKTSSKRMLNHLPRGAVDKWRMSDGILVMKVAMTEKFRQNADLAKKLLETGDQVLIQVNRSDPLWAVAMNDEDFKKWLEENDGKSFDIPVDVNGDIVGNFPKIGNGRNLQGFVIMSVRNQLRREIALAQELGALTTGTGSNADAKKE